MRFLFFTDTHIRGTSPKSRKDNLYETLKCKFNEVIDISKRYDVDYILHGGDWFDRPDISPSIVRDFALIIKQFEKPIYSVAGNHDIYGHNPDTLGRTMLGLLEGIGMINLLKYNEKVFLKGNGVIVQLTGQAYNYEIDGPNFKNYYVIEKDERADFAINMVHGMLLDKPFFEGVNHTIIDNITDTEADITLAGHYHSGFGIKKINNKYFTNPGSIVRINSSIAELERKPGVLLIECSKAIGIKVDIINLSTALPGEKVLDRSQLETTYGRELKLHQFFQGIQASGEYKRMNIHDLIDEIAAAENIDNKVKKEAIRRIGSAQETLKFDEVNS